MNTQFPHGPREPFSMIYVHEFTAIKFLPVQEQLVAKLVVSNLRDPLGLQFLTIHQLAVYVNRSNRSMTSALMLV